MATSTLDVQYARSQFPALDSGFIHTDVAGGSQVAKVVVDRIVDYLVNTNAQLGAGHAVSVESTRRVFVQAPEEVAQLYNADPEEIVFGASSTMNIENLARGIEADIKDDEELVMMCEHEANFGPWKRLAARKGVPLKIWNARPMNPANPYSLAYKTEDLLSLVTSKTRIVTVSACSNILGSIIPVKEIVAALRKDAEAKGVRKLEVVVDCVAYAPHRYIDVKDWDVDYAVFSFYKIFGPHVSAMYTRKSSLTSSVTSLVHHFIQADDRGYKLQPGGAGYEIVWGATGSVEYLLSLTPSRSLRATFDAIAVYEQNLVKRIMEFLTAPEQWERGVRVVGDEATDFSRVPTIAFVVMGKPGKPISSTDIAALGNASGKIGFRSGHFYNYALVDSLLPKLDPEDGLIRISLVHYNTLEEVDVILKTIREALAALSE